MVKTDRLARLLQTRQCVYLVFFCLGAQPSQFIQILNSWSYSCLFGELQTKRPNTVKSKLAEFLKKEDQLRKCVLFKIMRERGGEGPRGRSAPSNFKLKDIIFGGFIDEKNFSFQCNICGTTLTRQNESEKHLRTDHFESYKSLFAKECLLQSMDHPRYKEWEYQEKNQVIN